MKLKNQKNIFRHFPIAQNATHWLVIALVLNVLLAMLFWWIGPLTHTNWGGDSFILLEGAYKVACGWIPHVDYYSPLGVFNFIVPALAIKFFGVTASILSISFGCWILFLTAVALALFWTRLPIRFHSWLIILVGIMASSSKQMDGISREVSYACSYNRYGEIILGIITLSVLIAPSAKTKIRVLQNVLCGVLISILLLLKVSFFCSCVSSADGWFI